MQLTPEEQRELRDLEAAFEENGGRGAGLADRIDDLRRKQRLVVKTALVRFELLEDPDVAEAQGHGGIDRVGFAEYLREIVEFPQDPEATPDEGYWVTVAEVLDVRRMDRKAGEEI